MKNKKINCRATITLILEGRFKNMENEKLKLKAEMLSKEIKEKKKELRKVYKQMELEEKVKYEGVIIFNENVSVKHLRDFETNLKHNIEVLNTEHLGLRHLAYEIQGCKEGYYFKYEFISNVKGINKLETLLRQNKDVLKFMEVKMED